MGFSHHWGLSPRVSGRKSAELSLGNPEGETWTSRLPPMGGGGPKDGELLFWPSCLQIPPVRSALPPHPALLPAAATGHSSFPQAA